MISLSPRLSAIIGLMDPVDTLADIGCDHGYILLRALESKRIKKAIAVDISSSSLKKCKQLLDLHVIEDSFQCRVGDGLKPLKKNEANACVIAGMGGQLIAKILEDSFDHLESMNYIILQPMQGIEELFRYLSQKTFVAIDHKLVREKDKYYPIIKVKLSRKADCFSWENFFHEKEFKHLCEKKISYLKNLEEKIRKHSNNKESLREISHNRKEWEAYYDKVR